MFFEKMAFSTSLAICRGIWDLEVCLLSSDIWEHSSIMLETWDICPDLMSSFGSCLPPEMYFPTGKKVLPGWMGLWRSRGIMGPRKVSVVQAASGN